MAKRRTFIFLVVWLALLILSFFSNFKIDTVKAQSNADLGGFSTFEWNGFNITIVSSWELIQNETDYDGDGVPDVISTVTFFNDTLMEIYVDDTRETGAYKWACAVINITGFDKVGKWEYNPATDVWAYTGLLNYGYLPYYGLPYEWANETGGYGFIVFGAGSGDKWYRLNFTAGYKEFKIYTGKGSEIISVKPKKIKYSNNEGFHSLDVEVATLKPKFTLYRWSREAFIELQLPNAVSKRRSFRDDMLTQKYDGFEAVYYPRSDIGEYGSFEFEIVFENKPSFNSITINVNFTNLKFYYQPPLYEEYGFSEPFSNSTFSVNATHVMRLINGTWVNEVYRPENVVGSYAVYHAYKMNNEYKAGKAFHIYRPKLIDAEGKTAWAELSVDEKRGVLTITLPQEFLDNAVYPVTIDPTFGYDTIGKSSISYSADYIQGSWFSCPEPGIANSITFYLYSSSYDDGPRKLGIYRRSDNSFVGGTAEYSGEPSPGWVTHPLESPQPLLSAEDYWLVHWGEDYALRYDSGTGKGGRQSVEYPGSWPDPWNPTSEDRIYSIYCTYTAEAANNPPNAPTLNSPSANSRFDPSESVQFTWTFSDPDAGDSQSAYQFQLDDDSDFSSPIIDTGKVSSSTSSTTQTLPSTVGLYYWRVKTWDSNDAEGAWSSGRPIIVDRVQVTLSISDNRIDIGTAMSWSFTATYAYDGSSATNYVTVTLNDTTTKNTVGKWAFTVSSITDSNYGLTAFTSNTVEVIWDALNATNYVVDAENGLVYVKVVYCYGNQPVPGANVSYAGLYAETNSSGWATFNVSSLANVGYNSTAAPLQDSTYGITVSLQNATIPFEKETVSPFVIKASAPITNADWNDVEGKLSFSSSGTIYVDVGDYGPPYQVEVNNEVWTNWSYDSTNQRVRINNVASTVVLVWEEGGGGEGGQSGGFIPPQPEEPVPQLPIVPPTVPPETMVNFGIFIIVIVIVGAFAYKQLESSQKTSAKWRKRREQAKKPIKWKRKKRFE